jgi:hypothetical protein
VLYRRAIFRLYDYFQQNYLNSYDNYDVITQANLYASQDGAHEMCRLPKIGHSSPFPVPSPGRSVTRARRLYESGLANSV